MVKQITPYFDGSHWVIENDYIRAKKISTIDEVQSILSHIKAKQVAAEQAMDKGLVAAAIMLMLPEKRLKLLAESLRTGAISRKKACRIARDSWLEVGEIYPYRLEWAEMFKVIMPDRDEFMTEKERAHLKLLPDEIKIYRGYNRAHSRSGLSWTMSKMIASQYASKFGEVKLAQGMVNKSDVVAYIAARGHHEIIIQSESSVVNQRAVSVVKGEEAMRWILNGNKGFL